MYSKYRNVSLLSPSNDLYKLFQDASDAAIHSINHRGLKLHAMMPSTRNGQCVGWKKTSSVKTFRAWLLYNWGSVLLKRLTNIFKAPTVPLDLNFTLASTYSRALTPFHWESADARSKRCSRVRTVCSRVRAACSRVRATCSRAWFYSQLKLTLACNHLHASGIVQSVDALEQDYMLSCIILLAI